MNTSTIMLLTALLGVAGTQPTEAASAPRVAGLAAVPEPASFGMLGIALGSTIIPRRRRVITLPRSP